MSALLRLSITLLCAPLAAHAAPARDAPHQFEFGGTAMGLSGMAPDVIIGPGAGMAGVAGSYGYRVADTWVADGTALLTDAESIVDGPRATVPDPDEASEFDLTWTVGFRW